MCRSLSEYQTFVFDCDGVVLNSNNVKTEAFYEVAKPFGKDLAQEFVEYHTANGGVSRYIKFHYFITNILKRPQDSVLLETLLENYANVVKNGLLNCDIALGLEKLREITSDANWLIASGGDQSELREVFGKKGLDHLFTGGIYGSPDTKEIIFEKGLSDGKIKTPALFLGDSKYDYMASQKFEGIDFIFLSGWSEVKDWEQWCNEFNIRWGVNVLDLLNTKI